MIINYYLSSVQNQINIQTKEWEDEFGYANRNNKYFLDNRLELLINQKNHCKFFKYFILYLLIYLCYRFNQNWTFIW